MDTEKHDIGVRRAGKIIRKLRLHNNDVILLKKGTVLATKDNMNALAQAIGESELSGIIVVVVDDFTDLSVLNEANMQEHGWFKFDSASAAIMNRILKERIENAEEKENENDVV